MEYGNGFWHTHATNVPGGPFTVQGQVGVLCKPHPGPQASYQDIRLLGQWLHEFVHEYRYGYRHHHFADGHIREPVLEYGTCLDACLGFARRLTAEGREWRLLSGIFSRDDVANPHYWLQVHSVQRYWIDVDPTMPAIARMLGLDWQQWLWAYCGATDCRRIVLASHEPPCSSFAPCRIL